MPKEYCIGPADGYWCQGDYCWIRWGICIWSSSEQASCMSLTNFFLRKKHSRT